jgi:hypothetical protein
MRTKTPAVGVDTATGVALLPNGIRVDSAAWFAWLAAPSTTSFAYPILAPEQGYIVGFLTLRREPRTRGGLYWSAYWHVGRRVHKAYVGPAERVTAARLHAVATALRAQVGSLTASPPPDQGKEGALPGRD